MYLKPLGSPAAASALSACALIDSSASLKPTHIAIDKAAKAMQIRKDMA